ncbi:hypothetical protein [Methylorubrum extorquens]|uniref:hypothetical protein n=1 Tax=Methylorubrum extorquens TaxID=408 RepID=UPI00209EDEB8|nr:hypothetical protein [Methylorubrum extorquens]MCP1540122.1 hypothetical protein [Methylorubrum extorquens]
MAKAERLAMHVRLVDLTGAKKDVRFKLPRKGARWQGPAKNLDDAVQKALKEGVDCPFPINFVTQED